MSLNVLETDEHGNIVAKPVIGWSVTTVEGVTVLAAFEYTESASKLNTEGRKIQFEFDTRAIVATCGLTNRRG